MANPLPDTRPVGRPAATLASNPAGEFVIDQNGPPAARLDPVTRRGYRRFVMGRLAVIAVCLAGLFVGYLFAPHSESGPKLCMARWVVGIPCPGCGLTRGVSYAARLDFPRAARFNLFSLPVFAVLVGVPVTALYELAKGRRYPWYRRLTEPPAANYLLAALLTYHAARLAWWFANGTLQSEYLARSWLFGSGAGW